MVHWPVPRLDTNIIIDALNEKKNRNSWLVDLAVTFRTVCQTCQHATRLRPGDTSVCRSQPHCRCARAAFSASGVLIATA
jgi:hypothetical protein